MEYILEGCFFGFLAYFVLTIFVMLGRNCVKNEPKNEPDGFRGIKWGESLPNIDDFDLIEQNGLVKIFNKKNEKLTFGGACLESIHYVFYKDQFFNVALKTKGHDNVNNLTDSLFDTFGTPKKTNLVQDKYQWKGQVATIEFDIVKLLDEAWVKIASTNLIEQKILEDKKSNKNAMEDL